MNNTLQQEYNQYVEITDFDLKLKREEKLKSLAHHAYNNDQVLVQYFNGLEKWNPQR